MIIASNGKAGDQQDLSEFFLHSSSETALAENRYACTKTPAFIGTSLK